MTSSQRIRWGMTFTLGLLLGMGMFSVHVVRSFSDAGDWVLHTTEVQKRLEKVLALLRHMESDARGFLLNDKREFQRSFERRRDELETLYEELCELTKDNPRQQERLREIKPMLAHKVAATVHAMEIHRQNTLERDAEAFVGTEDEVRLTDSVQDRITEMQAEESALLRARLGQARRSAGMGVTALAVGLLLDFGLLITVFGLIIRDRREREQAAIALRKSSDEVRDLYNRAPCGYHSLNQDGVIVAINDTELAWLGLQREEVLGRLRFRDLLVEQDVPRFDEEFARFKQQGAVKDVEFTLRRRDGTTFPALINAIALCDAEGRYLESRSTMVDITARVQAEQVLRQARAYAESIVDTVREPLVILTPDLHVNGANRSFYQTFQTAPAKVEGRLFNELDGGIWAVPDLVAALRDMVPNETSVSDFEIDREFPRIGRKVMLLNACKLDRPGNQTALILLAIEDITARKQAMDELESFSYSVSHDLRAPLRHIEGYSAMLESGLADGLPEPEQRRYLEVIAQSTRRMSALIDDLLALSRVGRATLQRAPIKLDELVADVREELCSETDGRAIDWAFAPLPRVVGDRNLLHQVFFNLLSNAVKYTRRRSPARVEVFMAEQREAEVVLCVRDNGAGFDMRYADKLFRVFQRLHSATEFEGTGVGLAIVHRIIQRHGGRIWAEGSVGAGASFYFTLPRAA